MAAAIRAATSDDAPALVDLIDAVHSPDERVTLEEFRYTEGIRSPALAFSRLVVDDGGHLAAEAACGNAPGLPPHKFRLQIRVHPDRRRRGIGTELEARQRAFARERGGTDLGAIIREDDAGSRAFLERLGYAEAYRRFEMALDVPSFDWSRFAGWRERLAAQGLRLVTYAEAGDSEENRRRIYDLAALLSADVPNPEQPAFFAYEDFVKQLSVPGFRPEALFLAVAGSEWIGLSGMFCPEGRPAYTYFTAVRREHRGRGLATALKLATIEYARDHRIARMVTNNDTVNAPMVAVNERLGYRRLPARVVMRRAL